MNHRWTFVANSTWSGLARSVNNRIAHFLLSNVMTVSGVGVKHDRYVEHTSSAPIADIDISSDRMPSSCDEKLLSRGYTQKSPGCRNLTPAFHG